MKVEFVQTRLCHFEPLIERMRDRERLAFATLGTDPFRTLEKEVAYSHLSYVGLVDGQVAGMAGIHSEVILSDIAYIWMIGTDLVEKHPVAFYRQTRRFIEGLRKEYPTLYCWADADFRETRKWLQWLGFVPTGSWNNVIMFRT